MENTAFGAGVFVQTLNFKQPSIFAKTTLFFKNLLRRVQETRPVVSKIQKIKKKNYRNHSCIQNVSGRVCRVCTGHVSMTDMGGQESVRAS